MDPSSEATLLLKDLLKVGKSPNTGSGVVSTDTNTNINTSLLSSSYSTGTGSNGASAEKMADFSDFIHNFNGGNSCTRQQILLQGTDNANSFSVYGQDVSIISSTASGSSQASAGSNKVKISPAVNYDWESKYYTGNLVASHKNGVIIAYVLKGRTGGVVRLINRKTADRALLKGFTGRVIDISFAYLPQVLLGAVDEVGNLYVYEIQETISESIQANLLVQINQADKSITTEYHRLIWCPYIPDDDITEDDDIDPSEDVGKLLVLTHDNIAELWNIELILKEYGTGTFQPSEIEVGYSTIKDHSQAIADAAFSPDGTALATASLDGEVKVFQVYMYENTPPRCLHKWKPHEGKPLSCIYFLDDHQNPESQFWKFALTGADNNREIKIWTCQSWTCLQTIRFFAPPNLPSNFQVDPCLKLGIDLSAKYVLLTDIRRKVLYVCLVHQDWEAGTAHISSISEFLLTQPCLSFAVIDACRKKLRKQLDNNTSEFTAAEVEEDEDDETDGCETKVDDASRIGVVVKMYSVHTKALQELQIQFQPESSVPGPTALSVSSMSQDESFRDALTDLSVENIMTSDVEASLSNSKPMLLTPDAFKSSPRKGTDGLDALDSFRSSLTSSGGSSFTQVTPVMPSPVSSVTLTETPQSPSSPSNMPLPPTTPGEEHALDTSIKSLNSGAQFQTNSDLIDLTPTTSNQSARALQDDAPKLISLDSVPPPPATTMTTGKTHIYLSQVNLESKDVPLATSERVADYVNTTTDTHQRRQPLHSMGSASSASLEVNEILEPKKSTEGYDKKTYDHSIWPRAPDVTVEAKRLVVEALKKTTAGAGAGSADELDDDDVDDDEDEADDADDEEDVRVEEDQEDGVVVEEAREEESSQSAIPSSTTHHTGSGDSTGAVVISALDRSSLDKLQTSLDSIMSMIQSQQEEIAILRREMHHGQQLEQKLHQVQLQLPALQNQITRHVDGKIDRLSEEQKTKFHELQNERQNQEKQKQERLANAVTRSVNNTVSAKLENIIHNEIKTNVIPGITRNLDPIKDQLFNEVGQKLTTTDSLMREHIGKMVRSKQTIDAIGQAVSAAVQGPIQATYRDSFQSQVIPWFEKGCQNMFQQVNDAFQQGTREYMQQLESHLEQLRRKQQDSRDPMLTQLQSSIDTFQRNAEKLQESVITTMKKDIDQCVTGSVNRLQETLLSQIKTIIKSEVDSAMQSQHVTITDSVTQAMRSGAMTPVPSPTDPQALRSHLLNLLHQGQVNSVFQQALSASDLSLVMFVCENMDAVNVFGQTPCPLQQPVLLSLIQQLSADFSSNTELKHRFVAEAVMNLDRSNALTREHMPAVLSSLCQKLESFIHKHPSHKMIREMKLLSRAAMLELK
ncbi:enhancer of mRNA-decapping protein 4-like isoform X2 [Tubulanus polymorphus]|uniref:enhancer of mRNA-decapping protein 4-like isoform X2 n=1 Tax=Tubulanus polymorphus TaxID=672921 RepID=UPI003DA329A0